MAVMRLYGADALEERLTRTERGWRDVHPFFLRCTLIIYASVKQNFAAGGRPRWPGILMSIIATRKTINTPKHRMGELLRDSGRLMASVTSRDDGSVANETHGGNRHALEVGTNVKYANVQHFGFSGTVNQRVKEHERLQTKAWGRVIKNPQPVTVKAHSRTIQQNIAARPYLMMQPDDRQDFLVEAEKFWGFK